MIVHGSYISCGGGNVAARLATLADPSCNRVRCAVRKFVCDKPPFAFGQGGYSRPGLALTQHARSEPISMATWFRRIRTQTLGWDSCQAGRRRCHDRLDHFPMGDGPMAQSYDIEIRATQVRASRRRTTEGIKLGRIAQQIPRAPYQWTMGFRQDG